MSNHRDDVPNIGDRPTDPFVDTVGVPDVESPLTVAGFWRSEEDGWGRLYLSRNKYVEFETSNVLDYGELPRDQAPLPGEAGTWVKLKADTPVDLIRTGPIEPDDDFAVEVRLRLAASHLPSALDSTICRTRWFLCSTRFCEPALTLVGLPD